MFLLVSALTGGMAQQAKELQLTANVSESGCAGTRHTVAVTAHGGEAPYTYSWSDSRTGSFRNDLTGGSYTCTVTDANGKVARKTFNLAQLPQVLTASARQEKAGDKMMVHIEIKGGVAPYFYYWYGEKVEEEKSTNRSKQLGAGRYLVIVQDANGCSKQLSFYINI